MPLSAKQWEIIRIRALKGTRRASARPSVYPPVQSTPTPFTSDASNTVNGTQGAANPFQSGSQSFGGMTQPALNGGQPAPQSASFPPTGSSTNSNPSFQFAPSNAGFNFSNTSNTPFNNPFANMTSANTGASQPSSSSGFQGSIFNIPPQAPIAPSPTPNNAPFAFGQSTSQSPHQSQQTSSSNIFGNIPTNPFGPAKDQPVSGIISHSGQAQANPPTSIFFGGSQAQQDQPPSIFFGSSTPKTGPAQSPESMSTTPDTSPQAIEQQQAPNPFVSLNVPASPTPQRGTSSVFSNSTSIPAASEKSQDVTQPKQGGSLFDRISAPTTASDQVPSENNKPSTATESPKSIFAGLAPLAHPAPGTATTSYTKTDQSANNPLYAPFIRTPAPNSIAANNTASEPKAAPAHSSSSPLASQAAFEAPEAPPSFSVKSATGPAGEKSFALSNAVIPHDTSSISIGSAHRDLPSWSVIAEEHQKLSINTMWRLRALYMGIKRLCLRDTADYDAIMRYFEERKQAIMNAAGRPTESVSGKKRKLSLDEHETSSPKKARPAMSAFDFYTPKALTNGAYTNGASSGLNMQDQASSLKQSSPAKRKADVDISKENDQGGNNGAKKARSEGAVSYPSLSSSTGSETSNIFKSIVNNEGHRVSAGAAEQTNGDFGDNPAKQALGALSGSLDTSATPKGSLEETQDASTAPKPTTGNPFANIPPAASPSLFLPVGAAQSWFRPDAAKSSSFVPKAASPSETSGTTASPFEPAGTAGATVKPSSTRNTPFKPSGRAASPYSAPPAKPTVEKPKFQPPKFDAAATANFMSQFTQASKDSEAKEREKRKLEDYDSDEDNETDWERKYLEEQRAKKQKLEQSTKGKATKFVAGKGFIFTDEEGTHSDAESEASDSEQSSRAPSVSVFDQPPKPMSNGLNIFGHLSEAGSGVEGGQSNYYNDDVDDELSIPSDSSDEDEEGHDVDSAPDAHPGLASLKSQASTSASPPSMLSTPKPMEKPLFLGRSLFDRISRDDNGEPIRELPPDEDKNANGPFGSSSLQTGSSSIFGKPSSATSGTVPSIFDRISKDENGEPIRELPSKEEKNTSGLFGSTSSQTGSSSVFGKSSSATPSTVPSLFISKDEDDQQFQAKEDKKASGLFGSGSSQIGSSSVFGKPSSATPSTVPSQPFTGFSFGTPMSTPKTSPFGKLSAPSDSAPASAVDASLGDNTWKVDSPIKFGAASAAPSVQVTSPSPSKSPFGSLFGSPQGSGSTEAPSKSTSGLFGSTSTKGPNVGFGFSTDSPSNPTSSTLLPPSDAAANDTSRGTSPGASSVADSTESHAGYGTDGPAEEEQDQEEQLDLTKGPGEEDEDTLFEVRAKAMTSDKETKNWIGKGVGPLRILKHSETGKTRILMRQDPSGKIVINAALLSSIEYKYATPKSVMVAVAADTGTLVKYLIRVGKDEDAKELAKILEGNKKN